MLIALTVLSKAATIGKRGQSHQSGEGPAKVTLAAKPQKVTYLCNGFIACGEQRLSSRNPKALQIGMKSLAGNLLEESHELNLAHGAKASRSGGGDELAVVLVNELKKGSEALDILLSAFKGVLHSHVLVVVLKKEQEQHPQVRLHGQSRHVVAWGKFPVDSHH
jgi:hypothetical protein